MNIAKTADVLVIPADATEPLRYVEIDATSYTDPLRALVGGWIELVRLPPPFDASQDRSVQMVVDEEGVFKGKPLNLRASALYAGPQIVGNVVIARFGQDYERDLDYLISIRSVVEHVENFGPMALESFRWVGARLNGEN